MSSLFKKMKQHPWWNAVASFLVQLKNRIQSIPWKTYWERLRRMPGKVKNSPFGRQVRTLYDKMKPFVIEAIDSMRKTNAWQKTAKQYNTIRQKVSLLVAKYKTSEFHRIVKKVFENYVKPAAEWLKKQLLLTPTYLKRAYAALCAFILKVRKSPQWQWLVHKSQKAYAAAKRFLDKVNDNLQPDKLVEHYRTMVSFARKTIDRGKNSVFWQKMVNSKPVVALLGYIDKCRFYLKKAASYIVQTKAWQKLKEISIIVFSFIKKQLERFKQSKTYNRLVQFKDQHIHPGIDWLAVKLRLFWRRIPKDLLLFSLITLFVGSFFLSAARELDSKGFYQIRFKCYPDSVQVIQQNSLQLITDFLDTLEYGKSYPYKFTAPGYRPDSALIKFSIPAQKTAEKLFSLIYHVNLKRVSPENQLQEKLQAYTRPAFIKVTGLDSEYVYTLNDSVLEAEKTYIFEEGLYRLKIDKPGKNIIAQDGEIFLATQDTFNIAIKLDERIPVVVPEYAFLTVNTNRTGSIIKILQKRKKIFQSKSPCTRRLLPGRYRIEAINPGGYMATYKSVNLKPNQKLELNLDLRILPKTLTIYTNPPDADVYVNDERQFGRTPITMELREEGQYNVVARKKGYYDKAEKFYFRKNMQIKVVRIKLEGKPLKFTINLEEEGRVYIDGRLINSKWQRQIFVRGITAGNHDILIKYKKNIPDKRYKNFFIKPINEWPYNL